MQNERTSNFKLSISENYESKVNSRNSCGSKERNSLNIVAQIIVILNGFES